MRRSAAAAGAGGGSLFFGHAGEGPFVVLRRIDSILKDKNEAVRNAYEKFKGKVADDKLEPILKSSRKP